MSGNNGVSEANQLVGIEISREYVKAIIVDPTTKTIVDYSESAIGPTKESSASSLLELTVNFDQLWSELLIQPQAQVSVSVGARHCGVGSGPEIDQWITSLEAQVGKRITRAGEPDTGVSYFPLKHVHELKLAFNSLEANMRLVELAPIAVSRLISSDNPCSVTMDSSIGWRARLHSGHVLEALAYPEGLETKKIQIEYHGQPISELKNLTGYSLAPKLTESGIDFEKVAVALGSTLGLIIQDSGSNLASGLDGSANFNEFRSIQSASTKTTQELKAIPSFPISEFNKQQSVAETSWPISAEIDAVVLDRETSLDALPVSDSKMASMSKIFEEEILDSQISLDSAQAPPMPDSDLLIANNTDPVLTKPPPLPLLKDSEVVEDPDLIKVRRINNNDLDELKNNQTIRLLVGLIGLVVVVILLFLVIP